MRITGVTSTIVDRRLHRTHRHFLCKVGTGDPGDNVRRAVAVRDARPEAATVRVDVTQAWDEATARWASPARHAGGIAVIEQPVHAAHIDARRGPDGPGFGATLDPDKPAYPQRRQAA